MLPKRMLRWSVLSLMFLVFLAAVGLGVWKQWQELATRRHVAMIFLEYHAGSVKDSERAARGQKNPALKKWFTDQAAWHRKQEARHRWNANHPWVEDKDSFTTMRMGPVGMPELTMPPVALPPVSLPSAPASPSLMHRH